MNDYNIYGALLQFNVAQLRLPPPPWSQEMSLWMMGLLGVLQSNHGSALGFTVTDIRNVNRVSGEVLLRFTSARQEVNTTRAAIRNYELELIALLQNAVNFVRYGMFLSDGDHVHISVFDDTREVTLADRPLMSFTPESIIELLMRILQSDETLEFAATSLRVVFSRVRNYEGYTDNALSFNEFSKTSKSVFTVATTGDCLYHCLAIHQMHLTLPRKEFTNKRRSAKEREQLFRRMFQTRIPSTDNFLPQFEAICGFRIVIIEFGTLTIRYRGTNAWKNPCFLLTDQSGSLSHVNYIFPEKVGALWSRSRFCMHCLRGFREFEHSCAEICATCQSDECEGKDPARLTEKCDQCGGGYFDQSCYERHLDSRFHKKMRQCAECRLITTKKEMEAHRCGRRVCPDCRMDVSAYEISHACYVTPTPPKTDAEGNQMPEALAPVIYFDYECAFDGNVHVPVGIVAMYSTDEHAVHTFKNSADFVTWLFQKKHKGHFVIAHNGGRYDFHFLKLECINRKIKTSDVVRGRNIMLMRVPKFEIRIIDSYRFLPFSLRKFPKFLGLTNVKKTFFPYRFFTIDKLDYRGPIPAREWFDYEDMSGSERTDFDAWYAEISVNPNIDLYALCMNYCVDDVKLLRKGCNEFRENFWALNSYFVDPFVSTTIASAALRSYRVLHLPRNMLASGLERTELRNHHAMGAFREVLFREGYNEFSKKVQVTCFGSAVTVEIFALNAQKRVWMYQECLHHGCADCYKKFTVHPILARKMHELKHIFFKHVDALRQLGYFVQVMKECRWVRDIRYSPSSPTRGYVPFQMRDGFYGGRTEAVQEFHTCESTAAEASQNPRLEVCEEFHNCAIRSLEDSQNAQLDADDEGKEGFYFDFCSMYPSVMVGRMYGVTPDTYNTATTLYYPVGQPVRITPDSPDFVNDIHAYFGLIKCRVTCPDSIYLPLLPVRHNKKLVFPTGTFSGVWTSVELVEAVRCGYTVHQIDEVMHFAEKSNELFGTYIKTWLTEKIYASGFRKLGITADTAHEFARNYSQRFGLEIDPAKIGEFNPCKYQVAKLMLNSLWGKICERSPRSETVDVHTEEAYMELIANDQIEISGIILHDEISRTVRYSKKESLNIPPKHTNVPVSAFVTAYGRLCLFRILKILNRKLLYMDTDSVIFFKKKTAPMPVTVGPYLGDLTDELEGEGHIVEFWSTGPKSYGYKTSTGKTVVKVKGFTLSGKTLRVMNYDTMREFALNPLRAPVETFPLMFNISATHEVRTRQWDNGGKKFRHTQNKRRRVMGPVQDGDVTFIDTLPHRLDTDPPE